MVHLPLPKFLSLTTLLQPTLGGTRHRSGIGEKGAGGTDAQETPHQGNHLPLVALTSIIGCTLGTVKPHGETQLSGVEGIVCVSF